MHSYGCFLCDDITSAILESEENLRERQPRNHHGNDERAPPTRALAVVARFGEPELAVSVLLLLC